MFINFLLLQTGVNAYLKSHRKESRWDARFIEFLSFELFGTLGELLFERVKLGIVLWSPTGRRVGYFVSYGCFNFYSLCQWAYYQFQITNGRDENKETRRKKNLYSVARQVFDHIHDNETKPTFEKYSLFIL